MVAPPGALRWATRSASFVIPGCFGAVAFEFLRLVAFAARDPDFFLDDLMVMVFSSDIAAQIGAATGASPGWPGVVALTLLCAGKSSAFARFGDCNSPALQLVVFTLCSFSALRVGLILDPSRASEQ